MLRAKKRRPVETKVRLDAAVIRQLEEAAKRHGTSYNVEIASRVTRSFLEEEQLGGEEGRQLMYHYAVHFLLVGNAAADGRKFSEWRNDPDICIKAMFALCEAMLLTLPGISPENCVLYVESLKSRLMTQLLAKEMAKERAAMTKEGAT